MTETKDQATSKTRGIGWNAGEWLLGIFGALALFLGLFVAFGPEDEYIGLGGDLSWRVGDVSDVWMWALLIGGVALLGGMLVMAIAGRDRTHVLSTPFQDLMLHCAVFVIVNAFVWAQDFALGSGLDYALWVTIPWGVVLAAHGGMYFANRRKHTNIGPFEDMLKEEASNSKYERH